MARVERVQDEHGRAIEEGRHWNVRILGIVALMNLVAYVFFGVLRWLGK